MPARTKAASARAKRRPTPREGFPSFGRPLTGAPQGTLTDLGCPDCRGVLAGREIGEAGQLLFTCRVGHTFSGESLIGAKEEELEDAMWIAIESYDEMVTLHEELARRARANGGRSLAQAYERRARLAGKHLADLRRILTADGPAVAGRGRG
jgi:two-component system chemotaxis response regulator CheB